MLTAAVPCRIRGRLACRGVHARRCRACYVLLFNGHHIITSGDVPTRLDAPATPALSARDVCRGTATFYKRGRGTTAWLLSVYSSGRRYTGSCPRRAAITLPNQPTCDAVIIARGVSAEANVQLHLSGSRLKWHERSIRTQRGQTHLSHCAPIHAGGASTLPAYIYRYHIRAMLY